MMIVIEAASIRDARLAWQSAQYARFAYHQPNEMPDMPGAEPAPETNRAADVVEAKAIMRAMAGEVKNGS